MVSNQVPPGGKADIMLEARGMRKGREGVYADRKKRMLVGITVNIPQSHTASTYKRDASAPQPIRGRPLALV